MKATLSLTFCALLGHLSLVQAQPEVLSPAQRILRACANSYQSLREFKGTATVISQSRIGSDMSEATTLTQSADAGFDFARNIRFNITGHDAGHRTFDIKSTPEKTTHSWELEKDKPAQDDKNIESAVATFTGVAAHAPTLIPALLLSTQWGQPFDSKNAATLQGTEVFGGHRCYVVIQQTGGRQPQTNTLWIDAKSFLLRGIREEQGQYTFNVDAIGGIPAQKAKVYFGNSMHIFAIDETLPGENELLAAAQKTVDVPLVEAELAKR